MVGFRRDLLTRLTLKVFRFSADHSHFYLKRNMCHVSYNINVPEEEVKTTTVTP
jgi:hypothetical protein